MARVKPAMFVNNICYKCFEFVCLSLRTVREGKLKLQSLQTNISRPSFLRMDYIFDNLFQHLKFCTKANQLTAVVRTLKLRIN